jgi:cell division septation protein DedD
MSILPQGAREAAKPAEAPRRVASTPAVPAPQAKAAPASGGYAVQLAAPGSESEANSMFAFFQRKYPDDLGNQTALIRKAEVNGRSIYRLRVGPMSHDDAISLCTRLKTAGGSCFVAKN